MRLFYYIAAAALLSAFSVEASAENYIVREDRVWEYGATTGYNWDSRYDYKMRFDGVTEVDGKTYHNLIIFDAYASWRNWPDPELHVKELEPRDVYLMREEDGKVFLRVPEDWYVDEKETIVYDFTASVGEEFPIATPLFGMRHAKKTFAYEIDVNGEKCKAYEMNLEEGPDMLGPYQIIEGLGNVTWGCLPMFIVDKRTGDNFLPGVVPIYDWEDALYRVTDLDGNVICEKNKFFGWPWENPLRTDGMLCEDLRWNYQLIHYNADGTAMDKTPYYNYHFKGTEEIGGKTYHVFRDGDENPVALMRQEDDRVYIYLDDNRYCDLYGEQQGHSREMLLYDFSVDITSEYESIGFDDNGGNMFCPVNIKVVDYFSANINDINFHFQKNEVDPERTPSDNYTVVREVGPQYGRIDNPQRGLHATDVTDTYWMLETMTDPDGNVLFEYKDFGVDVSVKPVNADNIRIHTENGTIRVTGINEGGCVSLYDIAGRLVATAQSYESKATLKPQTPGLYLIRVGNRTFRHLVR